MLFYSLVGERKKEKEEEEEKEGKEERKKLDFIIRKEL